MSEADAANMVMEAPYVSLPYSTNTECIVDANIRSVLTTTLLRSRPEPEPSDNAHNTLTIADVVRLTEAGKPCVIIDQMTLVGQDVPENSLFGSLRLITKHVANVSHLHDGRLQDLTYQLIALGVSPEFTAECVRQNEDLYASSLANTCLRKLLATTNEHREYILQKAIAKEIIFQKQQRLMRKKLRPKTDRAKITHLFHKNAINRPFEQLGIVEFEMMLVQWSVCIKSKTKLTKMFMDIQKRGEDTQKGYITLDEFLRWFERDGRNLLLRDSATRRKKWTAIRSGEYDKMSARLAVIQACVGRARARGRKLFRMILHHYRSSLPQRVTDQVEERNIIGIGGSTTTLGSSLSSVWTGDASVSCSLLTKDTSSSDSFSTTDKVNRMYIDAYEDLADKVTSAGGFEGAGEAWYTDVNALTDAGEFEHTDEYDGISKDENTTDEGSSFLGTDELECDGASGYSYEYADGDTDSGVEAKAPKQRLTTKDAQPTLYVESRKGGDVGEHRHADTDTDDLTSFVSEDASPYTDADGDTSIDEVIPKPGPPSLAKAPEQFLGCKDEDGHAGITKGEYGEVLPELAEATLLDSQYSYVDAAESNGDLNKTTVGDLNKVTGEVVQALWPYQGEDEDELSFPRDAVIRVLSKADDGWWEGNYNGKVGYFPGNYVTLVNSLL